MAPTPVRLDRSAVDPSHPRLDWPGRATSPLVVEPAPRTLCERWGGTPAGELVRGDNLGALAALDPGSVGLCYADPPFFSGAGYAFRTRAGGERYEMPAFDDTWPDLGAYLGFLEDRLRLVTRALAENGRLYLHLDAAAASHARILLDELLGPECFVREIIWRIGWVSGFKTRANNWIRNHDVILYYARPGAPFHKELKPQPEGYRRRGGGEGAGRPVDDVWDDLDSIQLKSFSNEKTGWGTQKNLALLERIIRASSDPGELVLDPFGGAGTTALAAAGLGRRFVSIDAHPLATHLGRRRLVDAGHAFEVRGEAPLVDGPVTARAEPVGEGVVVHLEDVPEARGPDGTAPLARLDAWWVADAEAPERPLWHDLRPGGRRPGTVLTTSGPLPAGPKVVVAIDLAGGRHEARL